MDSGSHGSCPSAGQQDGHQGAADTQDGRAGLSRYRTDPPPQLKKKPEAEATPGHRTARDTAWVSVSAKDSESS